METSLGGLRLVEAGVIRTTSELPLEERLKELGTEMSSLLAQLQPEMIAVEELYSHYEHPKTAIVMGHARGVIFLKAGEAGIPVYSYASTRVKKSLIGNGRASKEQVQNMICSILGIQHRLEPTDAADALAIAICHCRANETMRSLA